MDGLDRAPRRPVAALALALVVLAALLPAPAAAAAPSPFGAVRAADDVLSGGSAAGARILVRMRDGASGAERDAALRTVGAVAIGAIDDLGITRAAFLDSAADPSAALALLGRDPDVVWAEADSAVRLAFTPDDPYYLNDPLTGLGQWGVRKIAADRAWDVVRGAPAVTVAVIDTGADPGHPDLAAALLPAGTFVSDPSPLCSPSTRDDNTHGTHVAGIVGAAGNNGTGVAGVAFGVRILPIKALDCTGTGTMGDIAQAIVYAVNNGARIINVSLGAPDDSSALRAAVQAAVARNVLIVAAAGNCGLGGASCDLRNEVSYPAAYPNVLAVAATDVDDSHASFSTAASYVDVAAPGRRIVSTAPTYATYLSGSAGAPRNYAVISGTSQATPFVAGVAALVLSREPNLTLPQLIARLQGTADHLGTAGVNPEFGNGRVNAFAAVNGAAGPALTYGALYDVASVPRAVPFGVVTPMTVRLTNTSSFAWNATGANPVKLSYHWSDPTGGTVQWEGQRTALAADLPPGGTVTVAANVLAPPAPGPYTLRFDLVREGLTWFSGQNVATANVSTTVTSGMGATYRVSTAPVTTLALGTPGALSVTLANTGTRPWPAGGANPVHLSYHWLRADGSVAVWEGQRASLPSDVLPGAGASVTLPLLPPVATGGYVLRLDLVQEGVSWFAAQGVPTLDLPLNVTSGLTPLWTFSTTAMPILLPGGRVAVSVTVRNDGLAPWVAGGVNPVRLAAHIVDAAGGVVLWDGPRTPLDADVPVGGSFTGALLVPAPLVAGSYRVRADLVQEGVTWFSTQGAPVGELSFAVAADYRAGVAVSQTPVSRANPVAQVTVTNTSITTWTADGQVPIALAAHWYDAGGSVLVWDGPRTRLGAPLVPGASATLSVSLGSPPPGAAFLAVDVVADGLRWFGAGTARAVTFAP